VTDWGLSLVVWELPGRRCTRVAEWDSLATSPGELGVLLSPVALGTGAISIGGPGGATLACDVVRLGGGRGTGLDFAADGTELEVLGAFEVVCSAYVTF